VLNCVCKCVRERDRNRQVERDRASEIGSVYIVITNSESDRLFCLITQINTKKILQLEINKLH